MMREYLLTFDRSSLGQATEFVRARGDEEALSIARERARSSARSGRLIVSRSGVAVAFLTCRASPSAEIPTAAPDRECFAVA